MKVISIKTSIRLRQRRPALTFQEELSRTNALLLYKHEHQEEKDHLFLSDCIATNNITLNISDFQ